MLNFRCASLKPLKSQNKNQGQNAHDVSLNVAMAPKGEIHNKNMTAVLILNFTKHRVQLENL